MNCAKCGLDLPPGTRQCPKCGVVNEFRNAEAPKKAKPVVWVIAALAVIVIAAVAFAAVMASRAKPTVTQAPRGNLPPGNVVAAPPGQPQPGNVVSAPPGAPPQGAPAPPGVTKPKPPQAVVDYLAFVKKVEEHRQKLLKDTGTALGLAGGGSITAGVMDAMFGFAEDPFNDDKKDRTSQVNDELKRQYTNWASILKYFDGKAAPDECRAFSGAYREALARQIEFIAVTGAGVSSVKSASTAQKGQLLSEAQKLMKTAKAAQSRINGSCTAADQRMDELVAKYDMPKPFEVRPEEEGASGGIMGF